MPFSFEPMLHQSISVGDPNGYYTSYSFGTGFSGTGVYDDRKPGGLVYKLVKTTPQQDQRIRDYINKNKTKDPKKIYGLGIKKSNGVLGSQNCRTYSEDKYNEIHQLIGGEQY